MARACCTPSAWSSAMGIACSIRERRRASCLDPEIKRIRDLIRTLLYEAYFILVPCQLRDNDSNMKLMLTWCCCVRSRTRLLFRLHHRHASQVAIKLVVVQAEPH